MLADELTRIRDSEMEAGQIRKEAKKQAKKTLDDANSERERILQDARKKAEAVRADLNRAGQEEAEKEYASYLEKAKEQCDNMTAQAASRRDAAVKFIAERIVNASVNS